MERFCALTIDPTSSVPPIAKIISSLDEDLTRSFFRSANLLFSSKQLNETYTLVAIRELIELSPLKAKTSAADLNASASFKWLYLLFSISARKVSSDEELERARADYMFEAIHNYIINILYPFLLLNKLRYIDIYSYNK